MEESRIKSILDKHDVKKIYWYVEYPHRDRWTKTFSHADIMTGLGSLLSQPSSLLYVHMPYCHTQCYFCNCKTIISLDYENIRSYLAYLHREIGLYDNHFRTNGLNSNIREIHLGGGSPTYISEKDFRVLMEHLQSIVDFSKLTEFSIEVDPRRINPDRMSFYHSMGVNRISFGVQDFDVKVQEAINRVQPSFLIERLMTPEIRGLFPNGFNFDIMCGLPAQTRETFRRTIEKVIEMSPDRISVLSLGLVPKFSPHQLLMPLDKTPDLLQIKLFLNDAVEMLLSSGYIRTGAEHFAKPNDEVVIAMNQKSMAWNGLGPTPGRYSSVLGLGISAQSTWGSQYYAQNIYELLLWQDKISNNDFPLYRLYHLSGDDILRRYVIQTLRAYPSIDYERVQEEFGIDFPEYFADEIKRLESFVKDGLVELTDNSINITELGSLFADLIARVFDAYDHN